MVQLAPYDACTGCFACKAVCPHNAVEKHMDKHGLIKANANYAIVAKEFALYFTHILLQKHLFVLLLTV